MLWNEGRVSSGRVRYRKFTGNDRQQHLTVHIAAYPEAGVSPGAEKAVCARANVARYVERRVGLLPVCERATVLRSDAPFRARLRAGVGVSESRCGGPNTIIVILCYHGGI